MKKILLALFFALLPVLPIRAQTYEERIISLESDVTVNANNEALIKETIVYDFGLNERHGIYRQVPIRNKAENMPSKYFIYDLKWLSATQDGQAVNYKEERLSNDTKSIRIGHPDKVINGEHSYEITYRLSPVMSKDEAGDYLNLNITGNNWEVPINYASAKVTFEGLDIKESRCYTGLSGSTEQMCSYNDSAQPWVEFETISPLLSQEGLTINVLTESGNFATYQEPRNLPIPNLTPYTGFAIGGLMILFGATLRTKRWIQHEARKDDQTIFAQYEPPKDLSMAELGTLHDNASDMKEITATIIDLAVRGHLKINQTRAKSLFRSAEYSFDRLNSKDKLTDNEQKIMEIIFSDSSDQMNLKDIDRTTAAKGIQEMKQLVIENLETKGYRAKSSMLSSQKFINKIFVLSALLIILSAPVAAFITYKVDQNFEPIVPSSIFGIFMVVLGWLISTTIHITDTGYKKWSEIEGLLVYLVVAEKDRLAFHNAPEKTPEHFSALLPAAIALGVDKQWAKQFKDLDISQSVNWYSGQPGSTLSSIALADTLSGSLNSGISSNFTPQSQSSSGFSGGGFSGGGGGGGGGGSW